MFATIPEGTVGLPIEPTDASRPRLLNPNKLLKPNLSELYSIGPYGATIYSDLATRERYAEVLRKYLRLFTNDGKTVDIPKEE